eukprot:COSAG02_NODE_1535_length_12053_cov_13.122794_7_plen_80_part_00
MVEVTPGIRRLMRAHTPLMTGHKAHHVPGILCVVAPDVLGCLNGDSRIHRIWFVLIAVTLVLRAVQSTVPVLGYGTGIW